MKIFRSKYLLPVIAALATMQGCIKDDLSDCPPEYNVTLRYNYFYDTPQDVFAQRVGNVEVDIFDMTGNLVYSFFQDKPELDAFQGAKLSLEPGTYRIVCWGGIFDKTTIEKHNGIDNARVLHTSRDTQLSDTDDPMFYAPRIHDLSDPGADVCTITVPLIGEIDREIEFTGAHNTIEVFVKGFSDNASICPQIKVKNLASAYNFNMQIIPDLPMCYIQTSHPEFHVSSQYAVAKFQTALFENDNSVTIEIIRPSTGATMHTIELKKFLSENHITLRSADWNYIPVLVEFFDLDVTVTIPGWVSEIINPGT